MSLKNKSRFTATAGGVLNVYCANIITVYCRSRSVQSRSKKKRKSNSTIVHTARIIACIQLSFETLEFARLHKHAAPPAVV